MNALVKHDINYTQIPDLSTDELFTFLEQYGKPRVSRNSDGWHARIDMFVTGKGVEFEIKSDYKEKTPNAALKQCAERVIKTLEQLK